MTDFEKKGFEDKEFKDTESDMEEMEMGLIGGDKVEKAGYYRSTTGQIVHLDEGDILPTGEEDVTWEYYGLEKPDEWQERQQAA